MAQNFQLSTRSLRTFAFKTNNDIDTDIVLGHEQKVRRNARKTDDFQARGVARNLFGGGGINFCEGTKLQYSCSIAVLTLFLLLARYVPSEEEYYEISVRKCIY